MKKYLLIIISSIALVLGFSGVSGCAFPAQQSADQTKTKTDVDTDFVPDEGGTYTSMSEVAAYIHTYNHLPENYITKSEARKLGWESEKGNLWRVAPGKSIGGDVFSNFEKKLPEERGRKYYECDIDYNGGSRNAKRIVYSNDGLIYYTNDHYNSYTQIY